MTAEFMAEIVLPPIDEKRPDGHVEECPMTLCVAAACEFEKAPCVVACCDRAGSRGDLISEDTDKMRPIEGSHVMLAGALSPARELLAYCEESIKKYEAGGNELAVTELMKSLREAVRIRRREINDAYLSARYGLSFDEFFNFGKKQFREAHYLQVWHEINNLDLEAELILSSFSDDESILIHIARDGVVTWADHYVAIGTGAAICNAFLKQRDYNDQMPIQECLYRVLESKLAAEKDPYVGKATALEVLTLEIDYTLSDEYTKGIMAEIEKSRQIPPMTFEKSLLSEIA